MSNQETEQLTAQLQGTSSPKPSSDNRIAILGGTFDPPHLGHLALAQGAADALGVDQVVLIPTGNPHFKQDSKVTAAADRVAMTKLMASLDPRLAVSAIEVDRPGVTYTVDTLKALLEAHPGAQLLFIVGGDCVEHIWRWRGAKELAQLCKVIAVERKGEDFTAAQEVLAQSGIPFDIQYLELDVPQVSSTEVRHRAQAGESLKDLVPKPVEDYITQHQLYD